MTSLYQDDLSADANVKIAAAAMAGVVDYIISSRSLSPSALESLTEARDRYDRALNAYQLALGLLKLPKPTTLERYEE